MDAEAYQAEKDFGYSKEAETKPKGVGVSEPYVSIQTEAGFEFSRFARTLLLGYPKLV